MDAFLLAAAARVTDAQIQAARATDAQTKAFEPVPGADVVIVGLRSTPELNGQSGVIKERLEWPTNGRVAVRLNGTAQRSVSVKPANLQAWEPACFVCLETVGRTALLPTGCACRGSSGWIHEDCAMQAAAAAQERAGTWAGAGRNPWQTCPTCKVAYTGALKLALAREWCRRTASLSREDTQRFAAHTTLGNALSASGKLAEAEDVVRGNLEVATRLHGPEHPHTMGTTMNLGLLLSSQGKMDAAEAVYRELLPLQVLPTASAAGPPPSCARCRAS